MKKLILLFCLFPFVLNAQVKDWYGSDLSRLGYKASTFEFENARNGFASQWESEPTRKIKGGSFELSTDIFGKYVYFSLDGSFLLDAGAALFMNKSKERWWDNKEFRMDRSELIPTRLAFGANISPFFSIYAGGQYQYSTLAIQYRDNPDNRRDVFIAGNQRGFGIHAVGAYRFIHLRYSYMYDWIKAAKTYEGLAITNEVVLSVGPAKFGGFLKLTHTYKKMEGDYLPDDRTARSKNGLSTDYAMLPAEYANQFTVSVGIFAAGLFSGVTHAMSKGVGEVEQGLRNERNEDKKRKIEWVD